MTDLDRHPDHDTVVTVRLPREDREVGVPPERHHLVLLHAHAEGVEDPHRGVPHQLGGQVTQRTVEESVSECVVDQVGPEAEQRITVEYRGSVVAGHVAVDRPVGGEVVTGQGQGLHDGGRHDLPEHEDPLLPEPLLLLLAQEDGGGRGVGGGGVGRPDLVVGQGEGEAPEEGPEQHSEGQHCSHGHQAGGAQAGHFSSRAPARTESDGYYKDQLRR